MDSSILDFISGKSEHQCYTAKSHFSIQFKNWERCLVYKQFKMGLGHITLTLFKTILASIVSSRSVLSSLLMLRNIEHSLLEFYIAIVFVNIHATTQCWFHKGSQASFILYLWHKRKKYIYSGYWVGET
jgi:hypothetical protein